MRFMEVRNVFTSGMHQQNDRDVIYSCGITNKENTESTMF